MLNKTKQTKLFNSLKKYSKQYLNKKLTELDESGTRLMINSFLTDVLGFAPIEEIKTFSPRQIHLTNYKWVDTEKFKSWKDGSIDGELDLERIILHLANIPYIVTEVAESTGDYINIPDQLKLADMIRQYI